MPQNKATWGAADTQEAPIFNALVPKGRHCAYVEKAEAKIAQESGNKYYNLQWRIEAGKSEGRVVFQPIYLSHATNQEWLQGQFNSLKRIFMISGLEMPVGIPSPTEMQGLINLKYDIEVSIERDKTGKYDDKNKVQDVFPSTLAPPQQYGERGVTQETMSQQQYEAGQSPNPNDGFTSDGQSSAAPDEDFDDDDIPF